MAWILYTRLQIYVRKSCDLKHSKIPRTITRTTLPKWLICTNFNAFFMLNPNMETEIYLFLNFFMKLQTFSLLHEIRTRV